MTRQEFASIAQGIPLYPGVYKYFDADNRLIYVGKAKQLRKRISSYFTVKHDHQKTIELVRKINKIEFTIVENEQDALFLEDSLIKQYKPHYNINLKDDKTYPYVVIKNEPFPRVFITRRKINDGSIYFGPYTSVVNVQEILSFIKQYFPIRSCSLSLTEKNISRQKFSVCLEYHLGNCKGPCAGLQTATSYEEGLERLKEMLKGNIRPLMMELKKQMKVAAENMEFEQAASIQFKLKNLLEYKSKSTVVNTKTGNVDVITIHDGERHVAVNYLAVNEGSIVHTKNLFIEKKLEESAQEIIEIALNHLRKLFNSEAGEIITSMPLEFSLAAVKVSIPKAGEKKKLLDLSQKNADYYYQQQTTKQKIADTLVKQTDALDVLEELKNVLHLQTLPKHIECFDNSNFQGSNPVAAMVCFRDGIASKKEYRHYNIKDVQGIDDFASMREIVFRRYKRLKEEGQSLPDLVIIDGGKGQLNAAFDSIKSLELTGRFTLVGLAKNIEEIFFVGDQQSIKPEWNSESMRLIRRIRDEVHRFGISFHRNKRSKAALGHQLDGIKGIGPSTIEILLKRFRSVSNMRKKSFEEIASVIGKEKASIIFKAIHE